MSHPTLTLKDLNQARAGLNRLNDGRKIYDDATACQFINERGFVLLMPLEGIPLPSISAADEAAPWPGYNITDRAWAWKETLPQRKLCAYTKLIHGRGTFIDWRIYPSFLKVYGPDGDPDYEYENGRLNLAERDLCRVIQESGPIDSRQLWARVKTAFGGKRNRFTAVLERLQTRFYITVAGGSLEGWTLHTWDLVERQVPQSVLDNLPTPTEARAIILEQIIRNYVAVSERKLRSVLRWTPSELSQSIEALKNRALITGVVVEGEKEPWLMHL